MFTSVSQNCPLVKLFGDATIKANGVLFRVHKIRLCNCSVYFRALFICHSAPDREKFEIPDLSAAAMQQIIQLAYTGSVSVTEDNVQELFQAADQFIIPGIQQVCCNFLVQSLSPENCIGIWQLSNTYVCAELQQQAYRYLLNHFEEIVSKEELQQLSVQELSGILDSDRLNLKDECISIVAILKWVAHAPADRKQHVPVLMSKVRLPLSSQRFINTLIISAVSSNARGMKILKHAQRLRIYQLRASFPVYSDPTVCPRLPGSILFAIGGWTSSGPTNITEVYDVRANHWNTVTDHQERPRAYHGTVHCNGSIYCVGGFDEEGPTNAMRRFDLTTRTWHEVAPMYHRRCYVSVTVLNGHIYAIGGLRGARRLSSAERYDPKTNQWSLIAPLHETRSDASCTVLHNKIYICGGCTGNTYLKSCECYCPESNQWTGLAPMRSQRGGLGVIAYAEKIFAVGGFNGHRRLNSVEVYNPQTKTWSAASPMLTVRTNFGIAVIENKLLVVGGFTGILIISSVEYYDVLADRWSQTCQMGTARSGLSCCVVSELPNVEKYVISRDKLRRLDVQEVL